MIRAFHRIVGVSVATGTLILFFPFMAFAAATIDLNIIKQIESGSNPRAVNVATGCYGLYQISEICLEDYNRAHQSRLTREDLFNPGINERIASWYFARIAQWLCAYHIPVTVTTLIASYNWGIGHVRSWAEDGMEETGLPVETSRYIKKYIALASS